LGIGQREINNGGAESPKGIGKGLEHRIKKDLGLK
jgi:hypothetical protein